MLSRDVDRSPSRSSGTPLPDRLKDLFDSSPQPQGLPSTAEFPSQEPDTTAPTVQMLRQSSKSSTSRVPILRWFDRNSFTGDTETETVQGAIKDTHSEEHSAILRQAIQEQLPIKPPLAKIRPIPNSLHNPFGLSSSSRPPLIMSSLTRPTLPSYSSCGVEATSKFSLINEKNKRTSLDSLKYLSNREVHTAASNDDNFANLTRKDKQGADALLDESDQAETPQKQAEQIPQKYLTPQNPIVFCHGLLGFDSIQLGASFAPVQVSHWRGIKEVLEANGVEVLITRVPATSSIPERAKVLLDKISEIYSGREVHLIGHSMGGLDCRYLTTHLEKSFKVLSITTIAAPHRGSAFAKHFIETIGRARLPSVVSLLELLPNGGGDGKAFESLTIENMRHFNEETPDVEGVKYFSWGATYTPGLIDTWRWPHSVIMECEGPNDGLVSVESSKWGTYLGTLENVSHLDLVGWINAARYKWAEFTGRQIAFKPAAFYLGITDHLARAVEGQAPGESAVIGNEAIEGVDTSPAEHTARQEQMEEAASRNGVWDYEGDDRHEKPNVPTRSS